MRKTLLGVGVAVAALGLHLGRAPAYSHDWYPHDCCNGKDCAPVDHVTWFIPAGGGRPLMMARTSQSGRRPPGVVAGGLVAWRTGSIVACVIIAAALTAALRAL